MVSSRVSSLFALWVLTSGAAAHRFNWLNTLPDCWQKCLDNSGCDSSRCICDASQSSSYLTSAVACAISSCQATDWSLDFSLLGPLNLYCIASGDPISNDIMSSAYAAASATATTAAPSKTSQVAYSQAPSVQTTHKDGLTDVVTSTMTKTSTDSDGQTLEIIVPVVIGPSTMSFGKTVTSTLTGGKSDATDSPTSNAASPSQTPDASSPASTQAQQQSQAGSSTTSSQSAKKTSNSNGSPFENMQAGAGRWSVPGALVGLGAAAGVFMRL